MISDGIKKEEYREVKPFWNKVFGNTVIRIKGKDYYPHDVIICFSHGYAKNRPQNKFKCNGLRIGEGKKEWGAVPGKQYYILLIGEILPF